MSGDVNAFHPEGISDARRQEVEMLEDGAINIKKLADFLIAKKVEMPALSDDDTSPMGERIAHMLELVPGHTVILLQRLFMLDHYVSQHGNPALESALKKHFDEVAAMAAQTAYEKLSL